MLLGLARVSTREQDPTRQVDALTAAGCERVWVEHGVGGTRAVRPELDDLLSHARAGDTVVVTELSRLGRTVRRLWASSMTSLCVASAFAVSRRRSIRRPAATTA